MGDAGDPLDPLGRLMLAFDGHELPDDVGRRFATAPAAGMTLFRFFNSGSPAQVRELTAAVQRAASAFDPSAPPLLIAADQEGGQLDALGGATPFPGNMALGAAGDEDLAERVGRATGLELLAMGANVSYAPVLRSRRQPRQPAHRDPLLRQRARRRRPAVRGASCAACAARGSRPAASTSRASAARTSTRTTSWRWSPTTGRGSTAPSWSRSGPRSRRAPRS